MKKSTVLSGIASLLLVAGFYTFAFCLVEDVDEEPISMDFYYSTETDADTGEDIGEATSAAVSEYAGMDYCHARNQCAAGAAGHGKNFFQGKKLP